LGKIHAKIKLETFRIRRQNDAGGKDEPYLFTAFIRLDSYLLDSAVPVTSRVVALDFPKNMGHGDLGPASKGMKVGVNPSVNIPAALGERDFTLDSTNLDLSPAAMAACSAGVGAFFLEEDSTLDSTIREALPDLISQAHKTADVLLRIFLGWTPPIPPGPAGVALTTQIANIRAQLSSGFNLNGVVDGEGLLDQILASVIPREAGKALFKGGVPFGDIVNVVAAIVQGADHDEFLGSGFRSFTFFDLVGRANAPFQFTLDTGPDTSKGHYEITATAHRTDADEPPILAAMHGPGGKTILVARRLDGAGTLHRLRSANPGEPWEPLFGNKEFDGGVFTSGPAAASSSDGKLQCVAGRGTDARIWVSLSQDSGAKWPGWNPILAKTFHASAPAVAISENGQHIYAVARDTANAYWFSHSGDRGGTWAAWQMMGTGVFHSSPAMVRITDLDSRGVPHDFLVVAGLGTDNRVWTTRFAAGSALDKLGWQAVPAGLVVSTNKSFTSAPALAVNGAGKIVLFCRGRNNLFWFVESATKGRDFLATEWRHIGRPDTGSIRYPKGKRVGDLQANYSAPAVVASASPAGWLVAGLSATLGLWYTHETGPSQELWRPVTSEPENMTFRSSFF